MKNNRHSFLTYYDILCILETPEPTNPPAIDENIIYPGMPCKYLKTSEM